uniref:ribosomal protein S8 n=1 Tax=Haramonas pauciplastida TaxID=478668 RepID=UPI002113C826|nr:ribosomal protein S8 [Haramonas pauciplastida]UTE94968.1 ribosomal protein S8 [Haramonas pauciplastida]
MTNSIISDFTTRIRNGLLVRHQIIETKATKMTVDIAKILVNEGFIKSFEVIEEGMIQTMFIYLKYSITTKKPIIQNVRVISKPGQRIYVRKNNLPQAIGNFGTAIISTSKGIMSHRKARSLSLGGEVLLIIY